MDINKIVIDIERLEAALYEYFENIYDNPLEHDKEIKSYVDELMLIIKSVADE